MVFTLWAQSLQATVLSFDFTPCGRVNKDSLSLTNRAFCAVSEPSMLETYRARYSVVATARYLITEG